MTDATIHLRIPAATKARWVRASRAAGMRLTDYITSAVEAYMQQQLTRVAIPDDIEFSSLRLARDAEDLLAEVQAEAAAGQAFSYEPGRA